MIQLRFTQNGDSIRDERIKKASYYIRQRRDDIDFVPVSSASENETGYRGTMKLICDLNSRKTDVVVLDYTDLNNSKVKALMKDNNIGIATMIKRGDPRYVLITGKKHQNYRELWENGIRLKLLVNKMFRQKQIMNLFEGVECIIAQFSLEEQIHRVAKGEFDGAIVLADELKLLKLNNRKDITYHYLDCENMVPESGRAVICVLTRKDCELYEILRELSFARSEKEILIEHRVKKQIAMCSHLPIDYFCVHAQINKNNLKLYSDIGVSNHSFRLKETGLYNNRNMIIRHMVKKIDNIVEY